MCVSRRAAPTVREKLASQDETELCDGDTLFLFGEYHPFGVQISEELPVFGGDSNGGAGIGGATMGTLVSGGKAVVGWVVVPLWIENHLALIAPTAFDTARGAGGGSPKRRGHELCWVRAVVARRKQRFERQRRWQRSAGL